MIAIKKKGRGDDHFSFQKGAFFAKLYALVVSVRSLGNVVRQR
jgi:hypothetical protein